MHHTAAHHNGAQRRLGQGTIHHRFFSFFTTATRSRQVTTLRTRRAFTDLNRVSRLLISLVLQRNIFNAALTSMGTFHVTATRVRGDQHRRTIMRRRVNLLRRTRNARHRRIQVTQTNASRVRFANFLQQLTNGFHRRRAFNFATLPNRLPINGQPLGCIFPGHPTLLRVQRRAFSLTTGPHDRANRLPMDKEGPNFSFNTSRTDRR